MALSPTSAPRPFYYRHVPKNILLILLSLLFLPLSLTGVLISYVVSYFKPPSQPSNKQTPTPQKTILVTGISMTKGLTITRLLSLHTTHCIIGADIEAIPYTSPGRYSRSIASFHRLSAPDGDDSEPYIESLLTLIKKEKVDLWISCSSVVGAMEDGEVVRLAKKEMGSSFRAVQFQEDVVERLHEKDKFTSYVESLGLETPESHRCETDQQVLDILLKTATGGNGKSDEGKKFIMKPIGVDDRARAKMMTLLPFSDPGETTKYIKGLGVSPRNPFILQQHISGPEYCTHALVLRGRVRAFCACPSSELLMHYKAISPSSALFQKMLDFTKKVAEDGGEDFSGHLSFDFLAEKADGGKKEGEQVKLYSIECNPRAHTAVVLFSESEDMADAYSDFALHLDESPDLVVPTLVVPRMPCDSYYWIGHDLVTFVITPFLDVLFGAGRLDELREDVQVFGKHLAYWRDGTFVSWDPVPFLVLYHMYWPGMFLNTLMTGKVWSRINVSTTKVFVC